MSDPTSNEAPEDTPDDPGDVSGQVPDSPEAAHASGRVVHLPFPGVDNDYGLSPRPRVRARRVDPLLGLDLGGVVITRLIGEGGMGRVYEAHQANPARTVAVKVVRQGITTDQTMRRFEREAEFLSRLQHPAIARIHIVGTYASDLGDVPFYVMEYIPDARPITNYVHGRQLDLEARLTLFKQVCDAVAHGHDRGIVHRDLKPGNILIDGQGLPKIIDFGVARSMDSDLAITAMRTDTGQLVGTVQYMSPEQFGGDPEDLDSRCDIYSLGVVLYELVSGDMPYNVRRKPLHEASRVVCEQVPVPLRTLDRKIPKDVSAIADKCLQKDRRRRYHDAGHLSADLQRVLDGQPLEARPAGFLGWLAGFRGRRKRVGARIGLLLLAAMIASPGTLVLPVHPVSPSCPGTHPALCLDS